MQHAIETARNPHLPRCCVEIVFNLESTMTLCSPCARPTRQNPARSVVRIAAHVQAGQVQRGAVAKAPAGGGMPLFLQAKLLVGQPGDRYEREADQVAERVM